MRFFLFLPLSRSLALSGALPSFCADSDQQKQNPSLSLPPLEAGKINSHSHNRRVRAGQSPVASLVFEKMDLHINFCAFDAFRQIYLLWKNVIRGKWCFSLRAVSAIIDIFVFLEFRLVWLVFWFGWFVILDEISIIGKFGAIPGQIFLKNKLSLQFRLIPRFTVKFIYLRQNTICSKWCLTTWIVSALDVVYG